MTLITRSFADKHVVFIVFILVIRGEEMDEIESAGRNTMLRRVDCADVALRKKQIRHKNLEVWVIIVPVLAYYLVFNVVPLIAVFIISLFEWNGISGKPLFVGLENFRTLIVQDVYINAFRQTAYIGGIGMFASMTFGFFIALLLNLNIKGRGLFRTLWYLPVVTSYAIVSQMFTVMLNPMDGVFNKIAIKLGCEPIIWQNSTFWMVFWITVFGLWKGVGGTVVLFLAGLQSIDPSLYEAADIDGANGFHKMLRITIPLLKPITAFVFVTGIIGVFQLFDPIYFLTKGRPNGATNVIVYQLYKDAFVDFNMGVAGAVSVVILIVVFSLSLYSLKLTRTAVK